MGGVTVWEAAKWPPLPKRKQIFGMVQTYYERNRDRVLAKARARYQRKLGYIKARVQERCYAQAEWFRQWCINAGITCLLCPENDLRCLDFHHRDAATKIVKVQSMAIRGWSRASILTEVAKCDTICANCHRKEHLQTRPGRMPRAWLWDYKLGHPCGCGEAHPPCLDFHHRDPDTKIECVATLVANGRSRAIVMAEIAKCDLMCANCHRKYDEQYRKVVNCDARS